MDPWDFRQLAQDQLTANTKLVASASDFPRENMTTPHTETETKCFKTQQKWSFKPVGLKDCLSDETSRSEDLAAIPGIPSWKVSPWLPQNHHAKWSAQICDSEVTRRNGPKSRKHKPKKLLVTDTITCGPSLNHPKCPKHVQMFSLGAWEQHSDLSSSLMNGWITNGNESESDWSSNLPCRKSD